MQRGQRPVRFGSELTEGTYLQQRSHFVPVARSTDAVISCVEFVRSTSDTPNSVGRKSRYPLKNCPTSPGAPRITRADRFAAIVLSLRFSSRCKLTRSRTCVKVAQRSS